VSGCLEHWTIQHKLKSALICTVWSQCTYVPDGQTNIMTIARRFVLTNASCAKNTIKQHHKQKLSDLSLCLKHATVVDVTTNSIHWQQDYSEEVTVSGWNNVTLHAITHCMTCTRTLKTDEDRYKLDYHVFCSTLSGQPEHNYTTNYRK